jgi:predicted GIY-YIG superfamily endonuclease
VGDRSEAMREEARIKRLPRATKLEMVQAAPAGGALSPE